MAPSLFGRSSKGLLYGACSSESKERGGGQDKKESQKAEACRRGEEEEIVGVHLTTPE